MVPKPHKSSHYKAAGRSSGGLRQPKILDEDQVLQALRDVGAVSTGHFILSSGRHSDVYAEKFRALEHPDLALSLGAMPVALTVHVPGALVDIAARAAGKLPIGYLGTVAEIDDLSIFRDTVRQARQFGFAGGM